MGLQFRPMKDHDFTVLGGEVKTSQTRDSYMALQQGLDSPSLFGIKSSRVSWNSTISLERNNRRAYIKLCKPVFNHVLCRGDFSLLRKILGISKKDMEDIASYSVAWSCEDECLMKVSEIESGKFYIGAELVVKIIDNFDIDEAINETFYDILRKYTFKESATDDEIGEIGTSGDIHMAGGYYLTPCDLSMVKRGHNINEIEEVIATKYFHSAETRLSFLLNLQDKDNIYGMLQDHITVLPPGMRPSMDKRKDMWTKMYAKIIKADQDLRLTLSGSSTNEEIRVRYKALDNAVATFQYKTDPNDKRVKSILEKTKTKHGQIRALNLGKRQDYSGRCAVIINPFLPLDKIRIPTRVLPKLFRYHVVKYMEDKELARVLSRSNDEKCLTIIREKDLLNKIPIVLGRQPTLHKLGILSFWAEETSAEAIEVNPLVVVGYNMDFDGDTSWFSVPLSDEAIKEVTNLFLSTQNIFNPKTGNCIICPRQDILYGLYMCTRDDYKLGSPVGTYKSMDNVREALLERRIKVYDTVNVDGTNILVGHAAFISCFPSRTRIEVKQINAKTIKEYVTLMQSRRSATFARTINALVELGFKIAKLYSASVSLLTDMNDNEEYDNAFNVFHEAMREEDELYDLGLEDSTAYDVEFDMQFKHVEDSMKNNIKAKLGTDNAYWMLAESGARGNTSNLMQIFSYKGRISKSSTESFNAIIEDSFVSQLNSMDHFITAYGSRDGQMSKTLRTGDTGYLLRQMWHATSNFYIEEDDCGTTEGWTIRKSDLAQFFSSQDEINDVFYQIINGRYQAGSNLFITAQLAKTYTEDLDSITIRSPLKCKCSCCRKCYGIDLSTLEDSVIGAPIGFTAAHSIGETAQQTTLDQFHNGGVATKGIIISNFDRLSYYLHVSSIKSAAARGVYPLYDPLAWEDGEVHETSKNIVNKRVTIGDDKRTSVTLPQEAVLKKVCKKGEGLCMNRGDYDIHEIIKYNGVEAAEQYLVYMLLSILRSEEEVNIKHFEVMVASMIRHVIIKTDRLDLKIGQYYTTKELLSDSIENTRYYTRLIGIKDLQLTSNQALSNIVFENIGRGLSKAVLLGTEDDLVDPISRMCMGLTPLGGTYYSDYMENMKRR